MSDEIANNSNNNEKKSLDGRNFGIEMAEAFGEAGLIGTMVYVVLGALVNLPVSVLTLSEILPVSLVTAAIIAIVQIRKAFKRNYN